MRMMPRDSKIILSASFILAELLDQPIHIHRIDPSRYDFIPKAKQYAEGEGGFGGCEEQIVLGAAFEDHSLPPW